MGRAMTNRKAYITRIENELGSRKLIWIGTRGHDAWYRLPHTGDDRAMEIVDLHGGALGPRCIPCMHNTLTFPDRSEHYFLTEKPSLSALRMEVS